jgi:hypothetical protein
MTRASFLAGAAVIALLGSPDDASAQLMGGGFIQKKLAAPSGGYTGPGDVVSGWAFWGGLRAFSAATAGTKAANICNAGDANCADVNTLANGNFDVTTAQGAPLNCGGTGGTCTVKTLYDKSLGSGDLTNATVANRPTLGFSCAGLSAGRPCLAYSVSAFMTSGAAPTIAQPMTLVAAGLQTSNPGNRFVMIGDNGTVTAVFFGSAAGAGEVVGNNISASSALAFSSWGAIQGVASGASSSVTINGATTANAGGGTTGIPGFNLTSGTQLSGNTPGFVGDIAEIGIATTAFSAGTLSSMNSNIRAYWGF